MNPTLYCLITFAAVLLAVALNAWLMRKQDD